MTRMDARVPQLPLQEAKGAHRFCRYLYPCLSPSLSYYDCACACYNVWTPADILYRAWKASGKEDVPEAYRGEIEYGCVQGLVEAAVLAQAPTLAKDLRKVLGGFCDNKRHSGVDELLLRVTEPIIFRALQVLLGETQFSLLSHSTSSCFVTNPPPA